MKLFHGSNVKLTTLAIDSWVTNDYDVAYGFAQDKQEALGGGIFVYEIDVNETDIEWDVISMVCGIEDSRGTTLKNIELAY